MKEEPNSKASESETSGWDEQKSQLVPGRGSLQEGTDKERHLKEDGKKAFPVHDWDKYELLDLLGEGGMGRVFKARDRMLGRYVAIKFIREADEQLASRFMQEARAQAKINHDNVCKIYETGEIHGMLYIAMQYIDGGILSDIQEQATQEQKVRIMQEVAEGVHAAHRMGLIHRDIKPANIMVERMEDGSCKPYVTDFGLAREQAAEGLTMTGLVMGTPQYMSPEQARGEVHKLDRRSDIFSLGATFYQLLTGNLPFDAESTFDILRQLLEEDPQPLRKVNPAIPVDLETIIMKCLEKEVHRRYESAHALADDLSRYLDGEPIEARRSSLTYRLSRKAQKHKVIVIIVTLAILAIAVLGGYGIHTRLKAREQAALAYQFGQEIKEMESILRFAYMLPLHDINREKRMIEQRIIGMENRMKKLGKSGQGPGNYAIGRGFLALLKYEEALKKLQTAWHSEYREPDVAYALGRAMGALYQQKLKEAERNPDKKARKAEEEKLQKDYRDPALNYLRKGASIKTESPEYGEGLIAFYEKDWDEALAKSRQALRRIPWLVEAKQLEGDIYNALADEKRVKGKLKEAMAQYKLAEKAFNEAIEMAESNPENYEKLCSVWNACMEIETAFGKSQHLIHDYTLEACKSALKCNPESTKAFAEIGYAYRQWAEYLEYNGQNPMEALKKAIEAGDKAIKIDPDGVFAYNTVGNAYSSISEFVYNRGQDPRHASRKAIEYHKQALKLNPALSTTYSNIGITYAINADYEMQHGLDPTNSLREAVEYYNKGIEIDPENAHAHNNVGVAYEAMAIHEDSQGRDPRPLLHKAIESYRKAVEINSAFAISLENISLDYCFEAQYLLDHGKDPQEAIQEAIAYGKKALATNPNSTYSHNSIGLALKILIDYRLSQSIFDSNLKDQAVSHYNQSTAFKKDFIEPYLGMAGLYLLEAKHQATNNSNPLKSLQQVHNYLSEAFNINPSSLTAFFIKGELGLLQAKISMKKGKSPKGYFESSRSAYKQALDKNENNAEALYRMADYHYQYAQWLLSQKLNAIEEIEQASYLLDKALSIKSSYPPALKLNEALGKFKNATSF